MATQRSQAKKKVTKKEQVTKKEGSPVSKSFIGEVGAILLFALAIMVFASLITFDIADTGISNKNIKDGVRNALGLGGALFSSAMIQTFGAASFILPFLLLGFSIIRFKGQSISFAKWLGVIFTLTILSLSSATTNFIVKEEKAGGIIGSLLYSMLSQWIGTIGISILLLCFIPIFTKVLFNISLVNTASYFFAKAIATIQKFFTYIGDSFHTMIFKRRMERLYNEAIEDDILAIHNHDAGNEQKQHTRRSFSLKSTLTRYFGIKIDEQKNEDVFEDLMGLSQYGDESTSKQTYIKQMRNVQENDELIELPLAKTQEPAIELALSPSYKDDAMHSQNYIEDKYAQEYIQRETAGSTILPEENSLPDVALLGTAPKNILSPEEEQRIKSLGDKIIACLQEFKVNADLVGYTPGPVITQYEIRPHAGVRVSKFKNLGDDLALKLEAISVRVQAPIPETDLIGIEVPNKQRQTVYFQELITSKAFEKQQSLLTMALGKTTAGHPFFADLAQMPHLLVAGSTGAGKSVCLNSIILSILYKASPKEVQLLLIDPKRVEMQAYQDLPHLVHPVVTQMDLARSALQWAVEEMERRYSSMERMGSKDIVDYNAKVRRILASHADRADVLQEFPYMVIIIDELADLILTATKEVETNLTRLSQLARACGIHLIIATQRPSVDVVTALIKANFPSRIAFRVTSRYDSNTILDAIGAEKLLGRGDMLFKTTQTQRIHGAFVSSDEIDAVVDYWKSKEKPSYSIDFAQWQTERSTQSSSVGMFADENDPQYQEAVRYVYERGEASISAIQRRFRIGFNKAARYVEQMEQSGILENVGGTKRKVVRPL